VEQFQAIIPHFNGFILPALNFLALFIFVLIWRTHIRRAVDKQE
jgi:hypothetical protein